MSKVHVRVPHTKNPADIRAQIGEFEQMLTKYMVKVTWTGNKAELSNPAVSGNIDITDSFVEVNIKLGMMAKAMGIDGAKLEGSIKKRLEAALA